MSDIEQAWLVSPSRRKALARMAAWMAASPVAAAMAETDPRPLGEVRRALSLAEMQTAFDFEPVFFGNVLLPVYDYTAHGEGSEFTLRRNRQALFVRRVRDRSTPPVNGGPARNRREASPTRTGSGAWRRAAVPFWGRLPHSLSEHARELQGPHPINSTVRRGLDCLC